jgi:AcrR family transcriptional regulator
VTVGGWLAEDRAALAADRILDAAADLFTRRAAATVGMNDIAAAAGCSRATLYRYFDSRETLHTAYVRRESQRLSREMTAQLASITDPRARLIEGVLLAIRTVRDNPALASWFSGTARPIGGEMAGRSEVVTAVTEAFVTSLGAEDDAAVRRRSQWLLRVLTSLLLFPGADEEDERTMLAEFVVPVLIPDGEVRPA